LKFKVASPLASPVVSVGGRVTPLTGAVGDDGVTDDPLPEVVDVLTSLGGSAVGWYCGLVSVVWGPVLSTWVGTRSGSTVLRIGVSCSCFTTIGLESSEGGRGGSVGSTCAGSVGSTAGGAVGGARVGAATVGCTGSVGTLGCVGAGSEVTTASSALAIDRLDAQTRPNAIAAYRFFKGRRTPFRSVTRESIAAATPLATARGAHFTASRARLETEACVKDALSALQVLLATDSYSMYSERGIHERISAQPHHRERVREVHIPPPRHLTGAVAFCIGAGLLLLFSALCPGLGVQRGFAADATPPTPPTYIPTPIGSPPPPPTFTPTATAVSGSVTVTPVTTPAPGTATPAPTATAVKKTLSFSLDAARVAHINNPGNFSGLSSVKRGNPVWLMMYFTVHSVPHKETRTTTYAILRGAQTLYKVAYKGTVKTADIGRYSRYQLFTVPGTLPYGKYTFKATLKIGTVSRSKSWGFSVGTHEVAAKASS
jgi:hypothetical protein